MLTETITYGPFLAPAGTVVTAVNVTAIDGAGNHIGVSVAPEAPSASLTLTPGTWRVSAQAVDAAGNAVGPVALDPQTYTVTSNTLTVSIPVSMAGVNA